MLLALALAMGAAACAGPARPAADTSAASTTTTTAKPWVPGLGGSVTVGVDRAPTGCNPNTPGGDTWANHMILEPVLPSAFVVSPAGQPQPDSAVITQAEVVSPSPQTVVYTLNPKAVWSDGVPLSATDFIYAWRQQRGTTGAAAASIQGYNQIQSVTGSNGGHTVTVVFKSPFSDWEMLFSDLLPAHVMEKVGWNPPCTTVDPQVDLSAGPFLLQAVGAGTVTLVRNPHWWGQAPTLDQINVDVASGPPQLAGWLSHHKVQVVQPAGFTAAFLQAVGCLPSASSSVSVSTRFVQLEFATTTGATAQVAVRQALAAAVDRQSLVNHVVGWADSAIVPAASHIYAQAQDPYPRPLPATPQVAGQAHYVPPPVPATPTPSQPYPLTAQPAVTARLLVQAGYTKNASGGWVGSDGKPLTLRLAVDQTDTWAHQAGMVVANDLSAAGVTVTTVKAAGATAAGLDLSQGAADAAVLPFDATPFPTQALAWYTPLLGPAGTNGSENWSNLDDPALTHLLTTAAAQLNPVNAGGLYTQADMMLWKQMVALPLFAEPSALAWSDFTAGVADNPTGPGLLWFPQAWAIKVPPTSPDTAPSAPGAPTTG